jgi:hypothetical protein
VDINKTWEIIRVNIKTSSKEILSSYDLNQHEPRFGEECSEILVQGKAKK